MSETCGVSFRNKFKKLLHLVDFIIRKFVTMDGHMNVEFFLTSFGRNVFNIFRLTRATKLFFFFVILPINYFYLSTEHSKFPTYFLNSLFLSTCFQLCLLLLAVINL
jgi:hypothetical protein